MRILVSGSSGLVGSALLKRCQEPFPGEDLRQPPDVAPETVPGTVSVHRFEVIRLVRREPKPGGEIRWDPQAGQIRAAELEGLDAVVHLAGDNIAAGRWTTAKKGRIYGSRVEGTRLLAETLAKLLRPPEVFISASAVGFYGDRGEEELDEGSPPGAGFLAGVCRDWEAATEPASRAGIRVVNARLGMVLAREGGALARLVGLFRLGFGGRLGSGRQYLSWITLGDVVEAILFLVENDLLRGPVNLVAPQPVTNRQFTKTLGRVLHRPTILPAPAFALRLALGTMADEMLLSSARVRPRKLLQSRYPFCDPDLESVLRRVL